MEAGISCNKRAQQKERLHPQFHIGNPNDSDVIIKQHDLHITEQASNHVIHPYLFDPSIPVQARCNSSRPGAIFVPPCPTDPRPSTSPSHRGLTRKDLPSLHESSLTSRVANSHATKDGYTRAVGWSCECTDLALLHVAAKLLLVLLLNGAGLAAASRECLGQTQRPDQLHQVRVTSGTRHPWHKARDDRNSAKPQWKAEQKVE
eukprot:1152876-Pelagomonas_calceolata.AAC.5